MNEQQSDGKMPKALFFIWVALSIWGVYYLIRYAWPDLKEWNHKPRPVEAQRA